MTNATILHYYRVSDAQLDKVHRVEDIANRKIFYQVESASTAGLEYIVQWNPLRKRIECNCAAGLDNQVCWHARASLAHAEEVRQEKISRQEAAMIELAAEMAEEARAASPYTIEVDPTSSSLDGCKWEVAPSGRTCPMR